jgi:hypothetical protein
MANVEFKNLQQTVGIGLLLVMSPSQSMPLPSRIYYLPTITSTRISLTSDTELILSELHSEDMGRAMILRDFALKLLSNTIEHDEHLAAALNANFWDWYEPI